MSMQIINGLLSGKVPPDSVPPKVFQTAIDTIDHSICSQLAAIIHHPRFRELEGSWRGLHYLVERTAELEDTKIRLLDLNKHELQQDVSSAAKIEESEVYWKLREAAQGAGNSEPLGLLVGDYLFSSHPKDISVLSGMSRVAAACYCPFVSGAAPRMLGLEHYGDARQYRSVEKHMQSPELAAWRSYRDTVESRYVALVVPRAVAGHPFQQGRAAGNDFKYQEPGSGGAHRRTEVDPNELCWMSMAHVLAAQVLGVFSETGWFASLQDRDEGGQVSDLPVSHSLCAESCEQEGCSLGVHLYDPVPGFLAGCGFISLESSRSGQHGCFSSLPMTHKPRKYDRSEATTDAVLAADLAYILATARIAHYVQAMYHAWTVAGQPHGLDGFEEKLNSWLNDLSGPGAGEGRENSYPLVEARLELESRGRGAGSVLAKIWIRPALTWRETSAPLRMDLELSTA